jgi:hypothetical protein
MGIFFSTSKYSFPDLGGGKEYLEVLKKIPIKGN